jgi:hypothetical protein
VDVHWRNCQRHARLLLAEHDVPGRHSRALRRQPDAPRSRLRRLRGLRRHAVRYEVRPVDGPWRHLDRPRHGQRPSTVGDATDQFQPEVAAGPLGAVAISFYDRRQDCPDDISIRPQDVGRTNFCIDTSIQAYRDTGAGAVPVGSNVRISEFTWDPEQPDNDRRHRPDGLRRAQRPVHKPRVHRDYFGLAISDGNVYSLFVSTHYPSSVQGDGGGPVYYQQQVLSTVARSELGIG